MPTDWRIAGTGDFNGDGHLDIVWENKVTGERGMWLMNGVTVIGWAELTTISFWTGGSLLSLCQIKAKNLSFKRTAGFLPPANGFGNSSIFPRFLSEGGLKVQA